VPPTLKTLDVENWKSLKHVHLEFDAINVLIGPNGSGKSNVVQFFHMLNMMMTGNLQLFIGRAGGAGALLHYGPKQSPQIISSLTFSTDTGIDTYLFRLMHGAPDALIFAQENVSYKGFAHSGNAWVKEFGAGHRESRLDPASVQGNPTLAFVRSVLSRCRYFQFHDTSVEAFIRRTPRVDDDRFLRHEGGNVASILLRLRSEFPASYDDVVTRVHSVVPAFRDFVLEPENGFLRLDWLDAHRGDHFGPHLLSDGSIRLIALLTLLSLPKQMAPSVIVIDEPELGLFPAAIDVLVQAIRDASTRCQLVLATQSTRLVGYLNPSSLICCSWKDGESDVRRMSPADEFEFLDNYSLGDYMSR
jgi:predicted ATPase